MSGITKTIPRKHGIQAVDDLYSGAEGEFEFHMAGTPSRLNVGDYIYTIWDDMIVGRCQVIRIESGFVNPESGAARSLLFVRVPGELAKIPYPREGHRGTRYYDGEGWI